MQISGMSLTLTWPLRLCLLRVLLGVTATATSFPLSKHTGACGTTPTFSGWRVYLQFTWKAGLPPSPVEFSSHHCFYKFSCSWLLGSAAAPAFSGRLVYLQFSGRLPLPLSSALRVSTLLALCLFCCCLLFSFSFFPGWGSVCPGGYADLAQGCQWEYRMPLSSPCPHLPKPSGH
jgi:hypothetical protein